MPAVRIAIAVVVVAMACLPRAAADPEPIRLVYTAPANCPSVDELFAAIAARASVTRVETGNAREFRVTIVDQGDHATGTLAVTSGESVSTREVSGATCKETVVALSLVAALAVEQRASVVAKPPPPRARAHTQIAIGSGIEMEAGVAPDILVGVPVFVRIDRAALGLRLGFTRTLEDVARTDIPTGSTTTAFRLTLGWLDGCTAKRFWRLALIGCAGIEVGVLAGRGVVVGEPGERSTSLDCPTRAGRDRVPDRPDRGGARRARGGPTRPRPVLHRSHDHHQPGRRGHGRYRAHRLGRSAMIVRFRDQTAGPLPSMNNDAGSDNERARPPMPESTTALPMDAPDVQAIPVVGSVDHGRLRSLFDTNFDFVWRSLRRLGVPQLTVDDATQEVFLVASRRLADIQIGCERSFLFATALRVASDARRSASRHEHVDDSALERAGDPGPGPDELADQQRRREVLDRVLSELDLELRSVFVLYELEEMTMAEIATTLELAPGTVASRLRRPREQFQAAIVRLRRPS